MTKFKKMTYCRIENCLKIENCELKIYSCSRGETRTHDLSVMSAAL